MELTEDKTINYVGLSTVLHAALFVLATVISAKLSLIKPPPEVIEIQLTSQPMQHIAEPSAPAPLPKVTPVKVVKTKAIKAKEAVIKIPKRSMPPKIAKVARIVRHSVPHRAVPHYQTPTNINSEIVAPALDTPELERPTKIAAADLDESALNDDFAKIDKETHQKIAAEKAEMQKAEQEALASEDQALSEIEKQTKQEDAMMKAHVLADQKVAKEAADRQAAAMAAAEKAIADARAKALAAAKASNGNGGNGVRNLAELRQMPGNRKPDYDQDDRFHKREGEVMFEAYVTRDGRLTSFKMLKSSGHRSLDLKTLKAIRDWRFYPGQEGFVEIPYKWILEGGPEEMPATLRRKISEN